jgi:glycosyltransferase involved in cell wall biosynthesis
MTTRATEAVPSTTERSGPRVVIDARPALEPTRTGVGIYTDHLLRSLPAVDDDARYIAWYLHARGLLRSRRFLADVSGLSERASRFPARVYRRVSWRWDVPRLEWLVGFDAVLATNYVPPPTRSRAVVMVVHDLAGELFPETAPQHDARWWGRFDEALSSAAAVIVPSRSTREDLLTLHRQIDPDRVHVIHHGVDPEAFQPVPPEDVTRFGKRHGLEETPYVLFIGGLEPRKNLRRLVEAFARVPGEPRLVIAGGPVRWIPSEAARVRAGVAALAPGVRDRVIFTGYVAALEKRALIAGASVLAYPSLHEGFGFPVLEAMAAGVPVLASNGSSMPEVAGGDAVLVDPTDVDAIADGLTTLLGDNEVRTRLSSAGRERAGRFTWERCARETADVLHAAADRSQAL